MPMVPGHEQWTAASRGNNNAIQSDWHSSVVRNKHPASGYRYDRNRIIGEALYNGMQCHRQRQRIYKHIAPTATLNCVLFCVCLQLSSKPVCLFFQNARLRHPFPSLRVGRSGLRRVPPILWRSWRLQARGQEQPRGVLSAWSSQQLPRVSEEHQPRTSVPTTARALKR